MPRSRDHDHARWGLLCIISHFYALCTFTTAMARDSITALPSGETPSVRNFSYPYSPQQTGFFQQTFQRSYADPGMKRIRQAPEKREKGSITPKNQEYGPKRPLKASCTSIRSPLQHAIYAQQVGGIGCGPLPNARERKPVFLPLLKHGSATRIEMRT